MSKLLTHPLFFYVMRRYYFNASTSRFTLERILVRYCFIRLASLLSMIIEEGKRKGEGNYRAAYLRDERKEETVQAFLAKYGYHGIPIGYEIHHIVPLSQGGADSIKNMIMLSIEEHAKVTEAHAAYFKWR